MGELCFHDECAVMAASLPSGTGAAIRMVYDGLRLQQHRGQDGSGMVALVNGYTVMRKNKGLVTDVYSNEWLSRRADVAIGHNRYATQGNQARVNLQPQVASCKDGKIYLASNGDVTNFKKLRRRLQRQDVRFTSQNDAELLAWLIAKAYDRSGNIAEAIRSLHQTVTGAYSVVMLFKDRLYVFRDPLGFRPLVSAVLPNGGVAFASETIAFDILGADRNTYADVLAGAILEVVEGQVHEHVIGHRARRLCSFEDIYFSRPDGSINGISVSLRRRRIGWYLGRLSRRRHGEDTVVVGVPDSANKIAQGVAEATRNPLVQGLLRSHTAGRTFIESEQRVRDEGVKYKFNPDRYELEGKRVLLVDDSIVRGTTSRRIVRMIRNAGAAEVHLFIGSPPIRWPCFMGIATPRRKELIAAQHSVREIRKLVEADSLTYLTLEGLRTALGPLTQWEKRRFRKYLESLLKAPAGSLMGSVREALGQRNPRNRCYACFTGHYAIPVPLHQKKGAR